MRDGQRDSRLPGREPARLDAALAETLHLLELVRRENEVLTRLVRCVAELRAIAQARATLSKRTRLELAEAASQLAANHQVPATPDGGTTDKAYPPSRGAGS